MQLQENNKRWDGVMGTNMTCSDYFPTTAQCLPSFIPVCHFSFSLLNLMKQKQAKKNTARHIFLPHEHSPSVENFDTETGVSFHRLNKHLTENLPIPMINHFLLNNKMVFNSVISLRLYGGHSVPMNYLLI